VGGEKEEEGDGGGGGRGEGGVVVSKETYINVLSLWFFV